MYIYVCTVDILHVYLLYIASVSSLINGDPYGDININNIDDSYTSAFETSTSPTTGVSN